MKKKRKSRFGNRSQIITKKRLIIIFSTGGVVLAIALLFVTGRYLLIRQSQPTTIMFNPVADAQKDTGIAKILRINNITYSDLEYSAGGSTITFTIPKGPHVILSGSKDITDQVELLVKIIRKLGIENKNPTTINLQYSRPIVKF